MSSPDEGVPGDKLKIYQPTGAMSDETMLLNLSKRGSKKPLTLSGTETKTAPEDLGYAGEGAGVLSSPVSGANKRRRRSSAFAEMSAVVSDVKGEDLAVVVKQHNEEQAVSMISRMKRWAMRERSVFGLKLFTGKKGLSQQYRRGSLPTDASCIILDPKSNWLKRWDIFVMILLLYTAVVTPYEVGFTEPDWNFWFFLNRIIDVSFFVDLVFNFLTARFNEEEGVWIYTFPQIACIYLSSWFTIDLVSILPFDVVGMSFDAEIVDSFRVLRVVRLLRLLKLARILRASRIFARWENQINLSYSVMSLLKFMVGVTTIAHWMACAFRIVIDMEGHSNPRGPDNWLQGYMDMDEESAGLQYIAALYWSVMTITTIGYGDLVAKTTGERLLATACMLLGASIYAYVVGAVCGIVSGLDEATAKFHQTMDQLNLYMAEYHLPKPLQYTLREYFRHCRSLARERHYQDLLQQMSPTLRGQVAVFCHSSWICKVPFFNSATVSDEEREEFIIQIAMHIHPEAFAPNEAICRVNQPAEQMYIVQKGVVAKQGVILRGGSFFGEDMICKSYKRQYSVRTLTYVDVFRLDKKELMNIIQHDEFPATRLAIRRAAIALAFRIKFVTLAKAINIFSFGSVRRKSAQGGRRSRSGGAGSGIAGLLGVPQPLPSPPAVVNADEGAAAGAGAGAGASSVSAAAVAKPSDRSSADAGAGALASSVADAKEIPGAGRSRKGSSLGVDDMESDEGRIVAPPHAVTMASTAYKQLPTSAPMSTSMKDLMATMNLRHQQLMDGMMIQFNKLQKRVDELGDQMDAMQGAAQKKGMCC